MSHCIINKPHDISPLTHSLSPDQLPLLCTPLVFATYHVVYVTCTATSAPTIAFVLISPVHTDKKGTTECTPPGYISFCTFASHSCLHFALHLHSTYACTHTLPPLPSYLFTCIALLSDCIQLDSALFCSFSLIITNTPIHILSHYALLHTHSHSHSHSNYTSLFSSLHTCIETVPHPLIIPSEPHRAFIVIEPHSSYFIIAAEP